MAEVASHSEYIVYVDESGDHGLESIDPQYPMFVLAFCIFEKDDYSRLAAPALQQLKFRHFGHDMVILHERDIRKAQGPFEILINPERRNTFLGDLSELISNVPFTIIASAIDKRRLTASYQQPDNPYSLALGFCLERLHFFLGRKGVDGITHVIFEGRGRREDRELELEFRRVCEGGNYGGHTLPFKIEIADKRVNSCGLQLADLVARPIGRHVLDSAQPNRSFDVLEKKFDRHQERLYGCGLKVFP